MKTIGILNGPNLNRLGKREPAIYGHKTLADVEAELTNLAAELGVAIECFQSNHEGALIDKIQAWTERGIDGFILNPGGLTHTSVCLRDAVVTSDMPCIEVHISNIHRREEFRHRSLISAVAAGVIIGLGTNGYLLALRQLAQT